MADKNSAQYWNDRIKSVKNNRHYQRWVAKSKKIVQRFGGKSFNTENIAKQLNLVESEQTSGYNLLFRNVKIRLPYLLPYIPTVIVERENKDDDSAAKYAAMMLERIANSAVKKLDLNRVLNSIKLYAELYGFATPWLRYEQKVATREVEVLNEETGAIEIAEEEFVESESIVADLVNPCDLFMDPKKTVEEIKWIARRLKLTREDFKKKFPDIDEDNYSFSAPADESDADKADTKAKDDKRLPADNDICEVYEIWDKKSKKIYFYCPTIDNGTDELLGVMDYPCDIDFPCPLPLMYDEYPNTIFTPSRHSQFLEQYKQVDATTESMNKIIPTLWVNGFYAKDLVGLDKAFTKDNANAMVGIKIPAELLAKFPNATLKDFVVIFDRAAQVSTLTSLYEVREKLINDIQRGLGVIGLMEGQTNVQEGVQTNKIKGSFGTLWIQEDQKCVAEFVVRFFTLYLSMAAQMFEPETLIQESTIYEIPDYQEYQQQVAAAEQQLAAGQPVEIPENPFEAAIALLKSDYQRKIRLDIATEDTKAYVDAEYRQQLVELQGAIMENLTQFGDMVGEHPEFAPLFKSLMMQNVRAHRVGKQFEDEVERGIDFAIESLQRRLTQPQEPAQPDPTVVAAAQIEAQAKVQSAQISAQSRENIEAAKIQAGVAKDGNKVITDAQIKAGELQVKRDQLAEKAANDAAKIDIEQQKVDLKAAELNVNTELKTQELEIESALSIAKGLETGNFDADLTIS